ncbi:MAG: hypothetical protein ACE5JX_15215 [Acidobacteriota bacterium]
MKPLKLCALASFCLFLVAQTGETIPLADLLSSKEMRVYQSKPSYKDRMDLFRKVLERYSKDISSSVRKRNIEETIQHLKEIRALTHYGEKQAQRVKKPKELSSKQVKKLEIRVRKLVQTLADLAIAVPFEYREEFEATEQRLESFRNQLLKQLFGTALTPQESSGKRVAAGWATQSFWPLATETRQRRSSGVSGDQFTQAEYEKIQLAQKLSNRVKVFLKIAESRLREISTRIRDHQEKEQDPKESNPLEFFTPAQMVHAYSKAIDGVMVNIDDRAKRKTESKKEIHKSLKQLNKRILKFIPQLEAFQEFALQTRDEELYREVQKAMKTSDIARKGSQLGLGAPVK